MRFRVAPGCSSYREDRPEALPLDLCRKGDPEEVGDRRSKVREALPGPEVDGALPGSGREERRPLPRVVGRRGRGVAAVVSRQEQDPVRAERTPELREAPIERLDAASVPRSVVAVTVLRVEVDEV